MPYMQHVLFLAVSLFCGVEVVGHIDMYAWSNNN